MHTDDRPIVPIRRRALIAILLALTAVMLVAAGCGGDDEESSPATSGSGSSSAKIDDAQAIVDKWEQRPTEITVTEPVGKPIPEGKRITYIACGVEVCALQGELLQEAADTLGWTVTTVNTDGTPEKVSGAIATAIRDKADAIITQAASKDVLAKPLADAKAAGIPVVTCCSTDPPGTYLINTSTPEHGGRIGELMAAKVVVDSGGEAKSLFVNLSAFTILGEVGKKFESTMSDLCPDCTVDSVDIPLTSIGKDVPDRIVSYLRSHPDTNYVFLVEGSLAPGVKAALQAAGLTDKVKLVVQGGNQPVYQEIAAGKPWLAAAPSAIVSYDYAEMDGLARHFAGAEVDENPVPELWLMTPDNAPDDIGKVLPLVEDYKAQWAALWGK